MLNNIPPVTKNLLIINVGVFIILLISIQMGNTQLPDLLSAHYFNSPIFKPFQIVTHMFVHSMSDPFHILFNMMLLVMFGGHLERIWGAKKYFIFYFACGLGAIVLYNSIGMYELHTLKNLLIQDGFNMEMLDYNLANNLLDEIQYLPNMDRAHLNDYVNMSMSSMAGASGAIFGLLAGFAMLFPNTQLMLLFPPIPIKAKYLIGGYLVFEIYSSIYQSNDHIAHLAHVGGAIVGIILILVWRKFDKKNFY